jgi:hypothetical protein
MDLKQLGFQIRLGKRMSVIIGLSNVSLKLSHVSRPFSFLDELKESIAGRLVGHPHATPTEACISRRYVMLQ